MSPPDAPTVLVAILCLGGAARLTTTLFARHPEIALGLVIALCAVVAAVVAIVSSGHVPL